MNNNTTDLNETNHMKELLKELKKIQAHLKKVGGGEITIGSTIITIKIPHGTKPINHIELG